MRMIIYPIVPIRNKSNRSIAINKISAIFPYKQ